MLHTLRCFKNFATILKPNFKQCYMFQGFLKILIQNKTREACHNDVQNSCWKIVGCNPEIMRWLYTIILTYEAIISADKTNIKPAYMEMGKM